MTNQKSDIFVPSFYSNGKSYTYRGGKKTGRMCVVAINSVGPLYYYIFWSVSNFSI